MNGQPNESGEGAHAHAAGAPAETPAAPGGASGDAGIEAKVVEVLHQVYDPEIPVDIYEMGLVYGIGVDGSKRVTVRMTLTSPACPVAESLPLEVRARVERIPEVSGCEVELVWDPPWSPQRMSEAAKLKLGML